MIIKLIINGFYYSFSPLISRYNYLLLKQRKSLEMTKKAPTELLLSWGVYYVIRKNGINRSCFFVVDLYTYNFANRRLFFTDYQLMLNLVFWV